MPTTYLQSTTPITLATDVFPNTKNKFDIYSKSPEYLQTKEILGKFFPEIKSFSISDHIGENLFELEIFKNQKLLNTWSQITDCNLHLGMVLNDTDNIHLFNFLGFCINMEMDDLSFPMFKFVQGREKLLNITNNFLNDDLSAIFIPLQTSKKELLTWINENWSQIKIENQKLPKFTPNHIPKNLLLGEEISDLKTKELTFAKISDILMEKYPDDKKLVDPNHIKTIHKRFIEYKENGITSAIVLNSLHSNTK